MTPEEKFFVRLGVAVAAIIVVRELIARLGA